MPPTGLEGVGEARGEEAATCTEGEEKRWVGGVEVRRKDGEGSRCVGCVTYDWFT